jgi:hypothetical protein
MTMPSYYHVLSIIAAFAFVIFVVMFMHPASHAGRPAAELPAGPQIIVSGATGVAATDALRREEFADVRHR